MTLHLGHVSRLSAPLRQTPSECTVEEACLGDRLCEAIHASTNQAIALYHQLHVWAELLTPKQLSELTNQEAEYERLSAEWRAIMESAYHTSILRKPTQ